MKRVSNVLAWISVAVVVAFAALNWSTLTASAPLNLLVAQVQAPLGVVMLGLSAVLLALFFVAYLRNQIGALLETRKLLMEVQRVQGLADKAEASRIDNLQHLMVTEFRLLNERLSTPAAARDTGSDQPFRPMGLTEIVTGRG
ncbi:MAG: LapA family protein [Burkholderiaceae bacterium]|nr:LapA family protein [Burkholderiaceae bacterium]